MAWIRTQNKDTARGALRRLLDRIVPGNEPVDNILAVHALHPRSLEDHFSLYRTLMYGPGPLSRRVREIVAVAVSVVNRCHY